ncbi:probable low affinity copper uptake protein 2 isoform X1 [Biomphalaria glabrata]|uniref:Copper transport protein n=1 Tax=Biomphalaria glabrata TaxID=6526 RepID=A0A9W3BA31_BIOGL|nr:probable low affinity copper uptake protein 2 isoform X1 [Biomphalaria glabrata]
MMGMYFDTTVLMNNILFENWNTTTAGGVVLASFLSFFFTALFEGLKTLKSYVLLLRKSDPFDKESIKKRGLQSRESQIDLVSQNSNNQTKGLKQWRGIMFTVESVLNLVSFFYAYLLMLIVMTYSVWLVLAVIIGAGVGYFFFHPISENLVVKFAAKPSPPKPVSCCSTTADASKGSQEQPKEHARLLQASVRDYQGIK